MTPAVVNVSENAIAEAQTTRRPFIPELAENHASEGLPSPVAPSRGVLIGILLGVAMWAIMLALVVPHIVG